MPIDSKSGAISASVPLEAVLCTEELERRPSRPPDYHAENQALRTLVQELTNSPENVLQKLVDVALELCRGHSTGISLLEEPGPPGVLSPAGDHFRWHAVAGQWAPLVWNTTTPRDNGPCGTVVDRNTTLLFANAHRHYAQFVDVHPQLVEGLLVPFHVNGQAVGTVWVVAHDETRKFDAEDQRLLESLATFAATAYQGRLAIASLAKSNQDLQVEIAERQRAEKALQDSDRRKSEFLAMLAHELRNPLAPIRHALQIVRLTGGLAEPVQAAHDMMERQVGQIVRLVDDLLDVSRISRGTIELRKRHVELDSVVNHAVEAARPTYEGAGIQLTVTLPPKPLYVDGDPTRLTQVVGNLLSNACKFTERGGDVRLTVERDDKDVVIRVQDTGIGIAADQVPHIFEMFRQIDTSLERTQSGLGIGLTLVKELVEQHGGTMEAYSAGISHGSAFVARLPIVVETTKPPLPEPTGTTPTTITPRRILVVDDNRDQAESLALILKLKGNVTHTAYDGLEAVAAAATFKPDAILLDIGLPKISGYEAARRIRAQSWGKKVLLVALTGWGQDQDRQKSRTAGFDDHLVKPVELASLTNLLARFPVEQSQQS